MRGIVVGAVSLVSLIITLGAQQPGLSKFDRQVAQQMLKQIREDLEKHYYDPKFRGVDLAAKVKEASARVDTAANASEASIVLADLLLQLDDSHTTFFPPGRAVRADYGWRMMIVGDAAFVEEVREDSDAAKQELERGDQVLSLNRFKPDRKNLWLINYLYRALRPQAQQRVVVRKPDGTERTLDIKSRVTQKQVLQFDDLIDDIYDDYFYGPPVHRVKALDPPNDTILVWRMGSFGDPEPVEANARKARGYKTLILDLRGNGGGAVSTLNTLVSWTFDREIHIATDRRRNKEEKYTSRPKRDPYTGPLIVLVDSRSGSAAEVFARLVQIEKRGTVLGDRTAGAVMTARFFPHTVGIGAIAFYATSITIGDLRMSDGGSLEKVGGTPDEIVLPSPADLQANRDPALARAITLAGGTITPEAAGKIFAK